MLKLLIAKEEVREGLVQAPVGVQPGRVIWPSGHEDYIEMI